MGGVTEERSQAVVEQYLEYLRTGDADGVAALYADDGVLEPPDHTRAKEYRGTEALRDHYEEGFRGNRLRIEATNWVVSGPKCVVEMVIRLNDEPSDRYVVDVFTLDDAGRIAKMTSYDR